MVRAKNRWIVVKVNTPENSRNNAQVLKSVLKPSVIKAEIDRNCEILFGLLEGTLISNSVSVPFVNHLEQLLLINCRRSQLQEVILVLKFINKVQSLSVGLEVVSISGTLHQSRKFILEKLYNSLSKLALINNIKSQDKAGLISGINKIQLVNTTN